MLLHDFVSYSLTITRGQCSNCFPDNIRGNLASSLSEHGDTVTPKRFKLCKVPSALYVPC
jgi:hypothetical protein